MKIDNFFNEQYNRKISINHFMFSKKVIFSLLSILIYYLFFKDNSKLDGFVYAIVIAYAMKSYIKTNMTFADKLGKVENKNKNIFLYALISKLKKRGVR